MDPTMVMGAMGALGQAAAGGPSAASSTQGDIGANFDGSGWTVSTGRGQSTGATITKPADGMPGGQMMAGYGFGMDMNTMLMMLMVGLVAWKVVKP